MNFLDKWVFRVVRAPTINDAITAGAAMRKGVGAPPTEDLQVVESEVMAWRGWAMGEDNDGPVLLSTNVPYLWTGATLVAHEVPAIGTSSGVYALKEMGGGTLEHDMYFNLAVYGQVALSGVVVEGELGYRAERATIRSLWLNNPDEWGKAGERWCAWELAGILGERYGVEVNIEPRRRRPSAEVKQDVLNNQRLNAMRGMQNHFGTTQQQWMAQSSGATPYPGQIIQW